MWAGGPIEAGQIHYVEPPVRRRPAPARGTFLAHPVLAASKLRALVRRQRRLERRLVTAARVVADEKRVRDEINALLVQAGIAKGTTVTCDGYELMHHERAGQQRLNADKLRGAGVSEIDIQFAIETGKAASYATVRPEKGAKVAA